MYEKFYNLKAEPFRLSPDHHFCYEHKGYAKARAYMGYAFMRAEGFVMITGRPGTGKTTLIGELIESLSDANVTTAHLVCTQLEADDLLKVAAYSFGVDHNIVEKGELLQQLDIMLRRWHRDERRALLIVDEAQDLSESAMEELRLLTNIQAGGVPLLQIFLLGQPELRDLVLSPSLEQVHQRIIAASHLESLEREETEAYIIHRLEKVGWRGDPALSRSIFPLVYKFSEGVPRRINLICSRMFLNGCVEQRHEIGVADVREVIKELQFEKLAVGKEFSDEEFELEDDFDYYVPNVDDDNEPAEDAQPSGATTDGEGGSAGHRQVEDDDADEVAAHAEEELEEEILEEIQDELLEEIEHDIEEELDELEPVTDTDIAEQEVALHHPEPGRAAAAGAEANYAEQRVSVGGVAAQLRALSEPDHDERRVAETASVDSSAQTSQVAAEDGPLPGQPWLSAVAQAAPAQVQPAVDAAPQAKQEAVVAGTETKGREKPSGNATFIIVGLALVFALLFGGLVHDLGLDPIKGWQSRAGQWWQSVMQDKTNASDAVAPSAGQDAQLIAQPPAAEPAISAAEPAPEQVETEQAPAPGS